MYIYLNSFPGATNQTLLAKFNHHHKRKTYYNVPQLREGAFEVMHYAGKVKYQVTVSILCNSDRESHINILTVLFNDVLSLNIKMTTLVFYGLIHCYIDLCRSH